jgi:hypothetical protein
VAIADRFRLVWTPFLKRQGGTTFQAVGVVCPPVLGSGGELTLQAGGRRYTARPMDLLRYPIQTPCQDDPVTYLWLVPRAARPLACKATWKTPLGGTHEDAFTLRPAEPTNVHVVFKTHLDIGYTHRVDDVLRLYQTSFMERLLANLEATADRTPGERFVWTLSTWLMDQCLDPEKVEPSRRKALEEHIRQGQVVWGLMPFTTHSEFFGLEEMCRSIYAARRLSERFGRPVPTAAKLTDVPAHTLSLGMAFAAAGGTFLQIGTNPESRPPQVPPMFWWQFPDGNRLLVHYHETYGTPLLPPESWPWREWLSIQMTNDNVGPQSLDAVNLVGWINANFDSPVCRTGRLEDFADAFAARHGRALPIVDKELTDWWIHGIASQADVTAQARRDKGRLPSAEALHALADWAAGRTPGEDLRAKVRDAFTHLSLYTEHTWGDHATDARKALPKGSLYTSAKFAIDEPPPPVDRWVASWEDKAAFARTAHALTEELQAGSMAAFSTVLNGPRRARASAGSVVVFNTLSWARGGIVRLGPQQLPAGEFELIDPTTRSAVPYERDENGIEFVAPPVPACGYLALEMRTAGQRSRPGLAAEWQAGPLGLHTPEYSLQFHTAGGLARWHDRRRSVQWCSNEVEHPLGAYLYEMPGGKRMRDFHRQVHSNCWGHSANFFHRYDYEEMADFGPVTGEPAGIHPVLTPLMAQVRVEGRIPPRKPAGRRSGDGQRYETTYTLYRGRPELHIRLRLFGKQATYAAEAGYAFFGFAVDNPYVLVDRIAHLTTPADDLARGVNAAHMAVHQGLRVEGDHAGMNFFALDTPLVAFGEPGAWAYNASGAYPKATLYATLFNNCWGTNFAQWQSGDFSFAFVLSPTGNDGWDGGLSTQGLELFRPLMATVVASSPVEPARSLLAIDPPAVQLVALKPADFEPGTVLRLWNSKLDPVRARIRLPAMRRSDALFGCDLLERTRRRIAVNAEGEATLTLKPHEIATLLLRPGKRG